MKENEKPHNGTSFSGANHWLEFFCHTAFDFICSSDINLARFYAFSILCMGHGVTRGKVNNGENELPNAFHFLV